MNTYNVKTVAIVGGGTSAWLAAAFLSSKKPDYDILVIDKEIGSPVGVGEGTLLGFGQIMEQCGFKPEEWFFEIDATFKSGIFFSLKCTTLLRRMIVLIKYPVKKQILISANKETVTLEKCKF